MHRVAQLYTLWETSSIRDIGNPGGCHACLVDQTQPENQRLDDCLESGRHCTRRTSYRKVRIDGLQE